MQIKTKKAVAITVHHSTPSEADILDKGLWQE